MKTNFPKTLLSSFYIGIQRRSPYLLLPKKPNESNQPNKKDQPPTNLDLDSYNTKTKNYQKIVTGHATLFDHFLDRDVDIDTKLSELLNLAINPCKDLGRTKLWLAYDRSAYLVVRKLCAGGG